MEKHNATSCLPGENLLFQKPSLKGNRITIKSSKTNPRQLIILCLESDFHSISKIKGILTVRKQRLKQVK